MSSMFFGPPGPDCNPHMYRIRQVLPQPVSPMMTTGIPHLEIKQSKMFKLGSIAQTNSTVRPALRLIQEDAGLQKLRQSGTAHLYY